MEYALPISISSYFYFGKLVTSFAPYQGGIQVGWIGPLWNSQPKKYDTWKNKRKYVGPKNLVKPTSLTM